VFDIGTNHSRRLDMALDYLTYLGTSTATPAAFNRALYRIGASFSVYTADDHLYIKLSGLQENFTASIQLLESLLSDARPNDEALEKLKQGLLKERSDDKLSKRKILFEAMSSYAKYGPQSPFTNVLTNTELQQISSDELLSEISNLIRYEHRVLYYGPQEPKSLAKELQGLRHMQKELIPVPAETPFEEIAPEENLVYVVDYDMTQAEILMLSQDNRYSPEQIPLITLFNEYYGGGMSSVVFQELREAKALAYSVFSIYRIPKNKDEHHYIFSYIGTQADKLPEALSGLGELMEKLPESPELFASAKAGIQEKIRTERVKREKILFTREEACKLGIDYDIRKNIYDHVGNITFDDISQFHKERFNSKKRIMMVLGRMENLDMETLGRYGTVKTLTLDEIFGY